MIVFSITTPDKTHRMNLESKEEAQRVMNLVANAMDNYTLLRLSLNNGSLTVNGSEITSANWSVQ